MKKCLCAVLAIALLFSLTGCSSKITKGEVTARRFTPAHSQVIVIPLVISNGKSSRTMLIPMVYHYADKWEITISTTDKDGKTETATYRVTKDVYDATPMSAEFVYDKSFTPTEPEYTREKQK